jgi:hypothetical protein
MEEMDEIEGMNEDFFLDRIAQLRAAASPLGHPFFTRLRKTMSRLVAATEALLHSHEVIPDRGDSVISGDYPTLMAHLLVDEGGTLYLIAHKPICYPHHQKTSHSSYLLAKFESFWSVADSVKSAKLTGNIKDQTFYSSILQLVIDMIQGGLTRLTTRFDIQMSNPFILVRDADDLISSVDLLVRLTPLQLRACRFPQRIKVPAFPMERTDVRYGQDLALLLSDFHPDPAFSWMQDTSHKAKRRDGTTLQHFRDIKKLPPDLNTLIAHAARRRGLRPNNHPKNVNAFWKMAKELTLDQLVSHTKPSVSHEAVEPMPPRARPPWAMYQFPKSVAAPHVSLRGPGPVVLPREEETHITGPHYFVHSGRVHDDRPHDVEERDAKIRKFLLARGDNPDDFDLETVKFEASQADLDALQVLDMEEFSYVLREMLKRNGRRVVPTCRPNNRTRFRALKAVYEHECSVAAHNAAVALSCNGGRTPRA